MDNNRVAELVLPLEEAKARLEEQEARLEKARAQLEKAKQPARSTTLNEYLEGCHALVFSKFIVETNKRITSKGPITNPKNKLYPWKLRRWEDFSEQRRITFEKLDSAFPAETRIFESQAFLQGLGERLAKRRIANENDVEYFQRIGVEDSVQTIIDGLKANETLMNVFGIGNGITFGDHQLCPDQRCAYKQDTNTGEKRSMAYIIDYKAPHKITLPHLRAAFREFNGANIYEKVICRASQPLVEDKEGLFQYHAEKLTAAAVTHIFDSMIGSGLEYGLLTTGEALVFLKIDWTDPMNLWYHLAEPSQEVRAHPDDFRHYTAVSQILAFSLTALGAQSHGGKERKLATLHLRRWAIDVDKVLPSTTPTGRQAPSSSSDHKPTNHIDEDRSSIPIRTTEQQDLRNQSPEPQMPISPDPNQPGTSDQGLRDQSENKNEGSSSRRPYCTQACLLALVRGGFLDKRCPNVTLHRGHLDPNRHPISHRQFLQLLKEQLRHTLDDGLVVLGKDGSRGALFEVTLLRYGYTFVSKGTVRRFVPVLEHEAVVYDRLQSMQGIDVPIYLGAIDFNDISRTYYYDFRVYIVYMMFLSWGGQALDEAQTVVKTDPEQKLVQSVQRMHERGVAHTDIRELNVLWNPESCQFMLIGFDQAILRDIPRPPSSQVIPQKRRASPDMGPVESTYQSKLQAWHNQEMKHQMACDIVAARFLF
ncbi:hypothetical protein F4819DRAFT_481549 [Hypoxylon fuscum]|nr:hypothetical protein F4819DRAFT_481549 [Hypoxylon fuscum]